MRHRTYLLDTVLHGPPALIVLMLHTAAMALPTAEDLLNKCTETLDKTHTSFVTQSKTHVHDDIKLADPEAASTNGERDTFLIKEFRTDGTRVKCITQMWYGPKAKFANSWSKRQYSSDTYDGDKRYDHVRPYNGAGRVTIFENYPEESREFLEQQFAYGDPSSQCFGYLIGDVERFDRILRRVSPEKMSVKEERLNGTTHYVISANTPNGKYAIWLNPAKGYHFSKAVVVREEGDVYFGRYKVEPGTSKKCVIENTQFKNSGRSWVPTRARSKMNDTLPNGGHMKSSYEIELKSIVINPNHDVLNSFSADDIANGARANIHGQPGFYTWQNGKLAPKID